MAFYRKCHVITKLILANEPTDQASKLNHLGCQLSHQGEVDANYELEKFNCKCDTIKRTSKNKTRIGTQIKLHKAMATSPGLYGSENWVLTEKDKKVQAADMRLLTSTLGVTRQDKLTTEAIRKTVKANSLNGTISKYRGRWFNRFTRTDDGRFPRNTLSCKPTGKRILDRPRKRWMSQIWGSAADGSPVHVVVVVEEVTYCVLSC
jgi:hypothetical protein